MYSQPSSGDSTPLFPSAPTISRQSATPPSESNRSPYKLPDIAVPTLPSDSFRSLQGKVDCHNPSNKWLKRDHSNFPHFCKQNPDEPQKCAYFATCGNYIRPSADDGNRGPPRKCIRENAKLGDKGCRTVLCPECFESVEQLEDELGGHFSGGLYYMLSVRSSEKNLKGRERQLKDDAGDVLATVVGGDENEIERARRELAEADGKLEETKRKLERVTSQLQELQGEGSEEENVDPLVSEVGATLGDMPKDDLPGDDLGKQIERLRREIQESEERSRRLAEAISEISIRLREELYASW